MSRSSPDQPDRLPGQTDQVEETSWYRAVSLKCVLGLALGVASPLAFLGPVLWLVPVLGIALAASGLRDVRRADRQLVGRTAGLVGLGLALLCGTAAASHETSRQWWIRAEAKEVASAWFDFLAADQPQLAHQLTVTPAARQPLDAAALWDYYRRDSAAAEELEQFVAVPLVRTLLALGDRALVRFWSTEKQTRYGRSSTYRSLDQIIQVYAVTYAGPEERTTFFCRLILERVTDATSGRTGWQIARYRGGVRPRS